MNRRIWIHTIAPRRSPTGLESRLQAATPQLASPPAKFSTQPRVHLDTATEVRSRREGCELSHNTSQACGVRGQSEATTPLWLLSNGRLTLCELPSAKAPPPPQHYTHLVTRKRGLLNLKRIAFPNPIPKGLRLKA